MSVTAFNQPVEGQIIEVSIIPTATNLTMDHALGVTLLYVDDVSDFDPDGGSLSLDGVEFGYSVIDYELNTISLTSATTVAYDANTIVTVLPISMEKWALVQVDPEEDAVKARVPHELYDQFIDGIREESERESVVIVIDRTAWAIRDVNAIEPAMDGQYIRDSSIDETKVSFDASTLGATEIFVQSTTPSANAIDDIWVDTGNGNLIKRWDGSSWVAIDDTRIAQALTKANAASTVFRQSSQPASGMETNDVWIDADDGKVYVYTGSSWVLSDDQRIAQVVASDAVKIQMFYQTSAPSSTGRVLNDLWIDTDDNQKLYRWDGSAWAVTDIANINYIISRGTDLVTNGQGNQETNYNFSGFTFDKLDVPIGPVGAFVTPAGVTGTKFTDEFMPVDTNKSFKFSFQAKQKQSTAGGSFMYSGIAPYDGYKLKIDPQHVMYQPNTLTTLAVALNPGATTITLTSSANWYGTAGKPAGASTHFRSIIWWDYVDPGGKAWPELTYSRNWSGSNYWADGGITGNVITLAAPYSGPARPVGTKLSNGSSGGTYMYGATVNTVIPTTWTAYSETISGTAPGGVSPSFATGWPIGTSYAKLIWLVNRTSAGGSDATSQHAIAGISFSDASAAQDRASHITTYYQTSQPASGMLEGDLWIDTDDGNKSYRYNGASWQVAQDQGIGQAITAAAGAQAVADGKARVFAQTTPPTGMLATDDGDLWIDTDDSNKLYRWSGSAWVMFSDAAGALSQANIALSTANGKNTVFYQTTTPSTTGRVVADLWFDTDDGNKPYRWNGSAWTAATFGDAAISNLDAGKITVGTLTGILIRTASSGAYVALDGTGGSVDRIKFPSGAIGELNPAYIQTLTTGSNNPRLAIYPGDVDGTALGPAVTIERNNVTLNSEFNINFNINGTPILSINDGYMESSVPMAVDIDWIAPTLTGGWVAYGSGHQAPGYRKDATGMVCLRGLVKSGGLGTANPIFTLPAGYRPSAIEIFLGSAQVGIARIDVNTAGQVWVQAYKASGTNADVSLAGIRFAPV